MVSKDFSVSIPSYVTLIPNVLMLNGRGPCVLEEMSSNLDNNYIELNIANSSFYAQCAGPMFISIQTSPELSKRKELKCERQAIDCRLSDWSEWSGCSTKSSQSESRTREILVKSENGGRACGQTKEERKCTHVDCVMSEWSGWTICNGEVKSRIRSIVVEPKNGGEKCPPLEETMSCRNCEVNSWGEWSKCDGKFIRRT